MKSNKSGFKNPRLGFAPRTYYKTFLLSEFGLIGLSEDFLDLQQAG